MPRKARIVFPGIPHLVTQYGNRRDEVFFTDEDRKLYLQWLREYRAEYRLDILAYCLMGNHIHLVAVPAEEDGLQRVLKPLHMRYAQRVNRRQGWSGHLWQGRFYSSPLDRDYMWAAIRYVERNPVRAGLVRKAERYPWSSAAAHCGLHEDDVLTRKAKWHNEIELISDWSAWLTEGDEPQELLTLRRNVEMGLPCGADAFIGRLEKVAGRMLRYRPRGRPRSRPE